MHRRSEAQLILAIRTASGPTSLELHRLRMRIFMGSGEYLPMSFAKSVGHPFCTADELRLADLSNLNKERK